MRSSPLRTLAAAILAVLLTAPGTGAQEAAPPSPNVVESTPQARLGGKVVGKDGKTPVAGATVRVSQLRTGEVLVSQPTDSHGAFALERVPYGYLDLVVETPDGGYVASKVLNVAPEAHLSVVLILARNEEMPQEWWAGRQPRTLPGSGTPAVGIATVREGGGGLFRGKKGIALLAGAGALAILALSGGNGESQASPSQ